MKKLLLTLLLCLILPCLASASPEATTYTNQEHNFQITLPPGWTAVEPPLDPMFLCTFTDGTTSIAEEGIFIRQPEYVDKMRSSATLADFSDKDKQELINAIAKSMTDYKIVSTKYTYLGDNYALIMLAEKQSDKTIPTHMSMCFFIHNGAFYAPFILTNKQDQLPLLPQIISSFKYITPPKAEEKLDLSQWETVLSDNAFITSVHPTDFTVNNDILTFLIAIRNKHTQNIFVYRNNLNLKTWEQRTEETIFYNKDGSFFSKDSTPSVWKPMNPKSPIGACILNLLDKAQIPFTPPAEEKLDLSQWEVLSKENDKIFLVNPTNFTINGDILTFWGATNNLQTKNIFVFRMSVNLKTWESRTEEGRAYDADGKFKGKMTDIIPWQPVEPNSSIEQSVNRLLNKQQTNKVENTP